MENTHSTNTKTESKPEVTKKTVVNSVLWTSIERYSSQGIQFIVSIIMARILTPTEYGVLGIISIFLSFSNIFINSGLERALIHKQDCKTIDYSTANLTNIIFSIVCYFVLYFSAPYIAKFYDMPIITPTLRVMSLTFIFGAVSGVSRTILTKKLRFKSISLVTLATSIFSGIIGISMAYMGFGIWALVYQSILASLFSAIWIMIAARYMPSFRFSLETFKELFGFGSKMLGSDLIWVIFQNIYPLLIGKGFNAQSVGYFSRAHSYSVLIPTNFSGVLEKVLFPVFANIQDDEERLKRFYTKSLTITSTFIFTGNFFLMGLAHPLIVLMISDKWLPCVPLLQILCLSTLVGHVNSINGRLLIAKGYPGAFLKMTSVTLPLTLIIVFISFFFGLIGLAWGSVISSLLGTCYCCYIFKKKTGINPIYCLKESINVFIVSGCIGVIALLLFKYLLLPTLANLIVVGTLMSVCYLILMKLMFPNIIKEIKSIIHR